MMKIWLFLPTFRKFVRNTSLVSEEDKFPVFFYEDELAIWFYKIIDGILFYTSISKSPEELAALPEGIIDQLKNKEFTSIEQVPENLVRPKIISINNVPIGTIG